VRQPVGDAVRAFAPTAVRAHLTITLESGPPAIVIGDPERVRQVLANVLENAAKYARSSITVGVVPGPTMTAVRVDDDGPGISPDDLPHVFERLYVSRRHPVRAEVGSGLGLAIVHQLAVAMGGDAAAGVAPTGGARIEVRLPTAEPLVIPPPASTIGAPSAV
jgi:two-component system OmpR family sensor kinase